LRSKAGILLCLEDELQLYMRRLNIERLGSENLELQKQQKLGLLRELIKLLNQDDRQIIELRNVHGMSYAQIRETLGLSPKALTSRLSRAREQIRELLKNLPESGSPNMPMAA